MKLLLTAICCISLCSFVNANRKSIYHKGWIDFNKNGKKDIYEDSKAPLNDRVEDLLKQMNTNEKTCQLVTLYGYGAVLKDELPTPEWKNEAWKDGIGNIDEQLTGLRNNGKLENVFPHSQHVISLNIIQKWFVEDTRLGIPADFTAEGIRGLNHYKATFFPAQIGIASSWNKDLVYQIGNITGKEAKTLGYTNVYSPVLDLARDPRWGRTIESYGENPYLVGQLGKQQVSGLRDAGVMSTCKHFAVYGVPIGGRDGACRTHPQVSEREMFALHLEPFRVAITEADAWGVMASYNDYNGIPVASNYFLLTEVLRNRWGMKGYIVSDSDAVEYVWNKHSIAGTYKEGIGEWLKAGGNVRTTFNAPENFLKPMREGIEDGTIAMSVIDDRVREVLKTKFLMGLFDAPFLDKPQEANKTVGVPEHVMVSLKSARESLVLLKNDKVNGKTILPLNKDEINTIAVIGPMAKEEKSLTSRYGPVEPEVISVVEGIKSAVGSTQVLYDKGCEVRDSNFPESDIIKEKPAGEEKKQIIHAVSVALKSDVVVVCLGDDHKTVGENMSRYNLDFSGYQKELLQAIQATGKPVVLVMLNGRPISCNWAQKNVPAIIEAWYPGQFTGKAVADVIFGDYNPGGKLPITFPKSVGQVPMAFPYQPGDTGFGDARVDDPLYPFGFGLSYTNFEFSNLNIKVENKDVNNPKVLVSCLVQNAGDRAGDEVVQLYLNDKVSSVITYEKVLRGFNRVTLKPGEAKLVQFELSLHDLGFYNKDMKFVVEPGEFDVWMGNSSVDDRLKGSFKL
ncbi:beta-glucosidase [Puteibacter caeruleilacunae]|nr:beta-glucosidase [Puteibacter caeruleilacunae]